MRWRWTVDRSSGRGSMWQAAYIEVVKTPSDFIMPFVVPTYIYRT